MLKTIVKDISIYSISDFVAKGTSFFAVIIYTRLISQDEVGAYGYILVLITLITAFLSMGIENAYSYYFFKFKTIQEKKALTTSLLLLFVFNSLILICVIFFFNDNITLLIFSTLEYKLAVFIAFITIPFKIISSFFGQALRNRFLAKLFVIFNSISIILTFIFMVIFIVVFQLGIASFFIAILLAELIVLPVKLYYIRDLIDFRIIRFDLIKKSLVYGLPFVPTAALHWIMGYIDRLMLKDMISLKAVGLYTVAVSMSTTIAILNNSISQAWTPHFLDSYEKDKEQTNVLFQKFFKGIVILTSVIFLLFGLLGETIIQYILEEPYHRAFIPFLILSCGVIFKVTTQVTATGITLKKKTIYFFYISAVSAVVNIGLNYILISRYQETGAAIATTSSYLLVTCLYGIATKKLIGLKLNQKLVILYLFLLGCGFLVATTTLYIKGILLFLIICSLAFGFKKGIRLI